MYGTELSLFSHIDLVWYTALACLAFLPLGWILINLLFAF